MMEHKIFMGKILKAKQDGYPFVMYRKPGDKLVCAMIQKDHHLNLVDTFDDSGFVMAPFDSTESAVLIANNNSNNFSCAVENFPVNALSFDQSNTDGSEKDDLKEAHMSLVRKGLYKIKENQVSKIVLSRKEEVVLKEFDISKVFEELLRKYSSAFVYVWFHPDVGLWLGASPETLLKTKGSKFITMSLAGTKKFQAEVDILWGEKEKREQQLVTDHIVENLKPFRFEVGEKYTKKAGNLLHICTDIKGEMNSKNNVSALIQKLHPTAAVCGFPKIEAKKFILQHELYDRTFYTGFLGELNMSEANSSLDSLNNQGVINSNLFVNLRCMNIEGVSKQTAILYIGGGITEGSDPLAEWQETVEKSFVMKSVLSTEN